MKITRTAPVSHRSEYDLLAVVTSGSITSKVIAAMIEGLVRPSSMKPEGVLPGLLTYCACSSKSAPYVAICTS